MLTNEELSRLLSDIEADNVERTVTVNDATTFCEAICAFANDLSGRGIAAVQAALHNNANPPAEFDTSQSTHFLATAREVQV